MYNFKETEKEIADYWQKDKIFEKSLENRKGKKRFVFFEGPPTANGLPHIGHYLTRVYKDLYCRYKTMQGFFVLRKAGWDTHGLPVEIEIEKQLGFKNKKDIEKYGIDKFNRKAKESVWKYKKEWEDMTRKMGFWLDLDNPYITYDNKYIESLWNIIRNIWDQELLYSAHRVVHYCSRCGTGLSSHEVAQGYRTITDKSVVVKFQITNNPEQKSKIFNGAGKLRTNSKILKPKTYILAWTTTPWTLPGNVALAVGRNIKYQVVSIKGRDENYILAKDRVGEVIKEEYEVVSDIDGQDLVGLGYGPPFSIERLKSDTSYKIYDADFVSTEDGTGIVHTAVMYGEDDYGLGTKVGLPKVHTVDEAGKFEDVNEELNGKYVKSKEAEDLIIKYLIANNLLFNTFEYEHEYPFCWRCDSALLYYAKKSWFIKMSAVNNKLLENNEKINWIPAHLKEGRFGQWIKEGKDWAFSRERYWGTPLPIWHCQSGKPQALNSNDKSSPKPKNKDNRQGCGHYVVAGSIKELEEQSIGKKNTYYLLRHSLSTRGEDGEDITISTDLEKDKYNLTEEGKKLVQKRADELRHEGIDIIYHSPFLRTKETAAIVAKELHVELFEDKRLSEIGHSSVCEGKSHKLCPLNEGREDMETKHDGGESWNDVRLRAMDFMNYVESEYSNKKVLIVSHGDPLLLIKHMAHGATSKEITFEESNGWYPEIAGLYKIDWRNIPRNEYGELDLHRPFIDQVILKCPNCQAKMKKIPDLCDVWFDSGAMPFAQWHWPFENKKIFKEQFPADFIVEAVDQTRGWFYTLLAVSTLMHQGAPYKNVISLGHVLDDKGKKMSKSRGNVISPFEVLDKVGADAARWYFYTMNSPGDYKLFMEKDVEVKLRGFIFTLRNCLRFYQLYSDSLSVVAYRPPVNLLDKWILSRLNGTIIKVSDSLDKYDPLTASRALESFVIEDFSNWWLRRSRKRKEVLPLLQYILLEISKLTAPFVPFIAEDLYLKLGADIKEMPSVHLNNWPRADKKSVDLKLEEEMLRVRDIIQAGLAVRKTKQIKVRQPLKSVSLSLAKNLKPDLENLIKEELNVKEIIYSREQEAVAVLDENLNQALISEGYSRELIRRIQDMRKEAKYMPTEEVYCQWYSNNRDLSDSVKQWSMDIKKEALFYDFMNGPKGTEVYDIEKDMELVPKKKIWLGIRKVKN